MRPTLALATLLLGAATLRDDRLIGLVGAVVGGVAAVVVLRGRALASVAPAVAMLATWAVTRAAAMPDEVFWRHLEVQRIGQGTLVVLWSVLVVGALLTVTPRRRHRFTDVAVVVAATAAWSTHSAFALFAVVWGLLALTGRAPGASPAHPVLRTAPVVAVGLVSLDLALTVLRPPPSPPSGPGAATQQAIERDNPWRALAAAHAWAASGDPQGLLAVARLAGGLGLMAEADDALAVIETDPRFVALRAEAAVVRRALAVGAP